MKLRSLAFVHNELDSKTHQKNDRVTSKLIPNRLHQSINCRSINQSYYVCVFWQQNCAGELVCSIQATLGWQSFSPRSTVHRIVHMASYDKRLLIAYKSTIISNPIPIHAQHGQTASKNLHLSLYSSSAQPSHFGLRKSTHILKNLRTKFFFLQKGEWYKWIFQINNVPITFNVSIVL